MNPILPNHCYVPDVEAHVASDGRIYLYGSWDVEANTDYCSDEYHVFSSDDMITWKDHGQSFHIDRAHSTQAQWLWAPDCIAKGNKHYLLYCGNDGSEGIAESDHPGGPFGKGFPIAGADGDGIDPAALVDDDGSVYYLWGQFELRGGRLTDDLRAVDPSTIHRCLLSEKEHGFHEGASLRKRNGIYYLVYTDISGGRASALGYATSREPLGPYQKRGIIIDNSGCDPDTWNNHGSIEEFNGQWYVFYHRSSHGSNYSRRVCVEPISFNEDGGIDPVEMTTQGASGPLALEQRMDAFRACLFAGRVRCEAVHRQDTSHPHVEVLTQIHNGDWAAYKYVDFAAGARRFHATAGSASPGGRIEIHVDSPDGPLLGVCQVPNTGGWKLWREVDTLLERPATGVHALYLVFRGGGGRLLDLLDFSFS